MKTYLRILVVCSVFLGIAACRDGKKDVITKHTIRGTVFNNCTDSGLAGVKVFLQTFKKDKALVQQRETVSGEGGKFEFRDAEIHSSDEYSYALHMESKSGTSAKTPEHAGFDGTTMYFNSNEVNIDFILKVTPRFLFFTLVFDKQSGVSINDSIRLNYRQEIFHKNVANLPYSLFAKCNGTTLTQKGTISGFPMGTWAIEFDKWVGGAHQTVYDSVYIGWADTKLYTVTW